MDERSGARARAEAHRPKRDGAKWAVAGGPQGSTDDLVGILAAEPERISPSALLRPVFQDYLLGPRLSDRRRELRTLPSRRCCSNGFWVGHQQPRRFSATLVEPAIARLLRKHELTMERRRPRIRCRNCSLREP